MTNRRLGALALLPVAAVAGCQSYRPAPASPAPGDGVRVLYAAPTDTPRGPACARSHAAGARAPTVADACGARYAAQSPSQRREPCE